MRYRRSLSNNVASILVAALSLTIIVGCGAPTGGGGGGSSAPDCLLEGAECQVDGDCCAGHLCNNGLCAPQDGDDDGQDDDDSGDGDGNGGGADAGDAADATQTTEFVNAALSDLNTSIEDGLADQAVGDLVTTLSQDASLTHVALGSDGKTLALADPDGTITYIGLDPPQRDLTRMAIERHLSGRVSDHDSLGFDPKTALRAQGYSQVEVVEPGSEKAAVFLPFAQDDLVFSEATLTGLRDMGYAVEVFRDDEVTLDEVIRVLKGGYGLIMFNTHGGTSGGGLFGGVEYTFVTLGERYRADHPEISSHAAGSICRYVDRKWAGGTWLEVRWCYQHGAIRKCPLFTIDSRVFGKYSYPNTLVIADGCNSLIIDDLSRAILDHGGGAFVGWRNYSHADIGEKAMQRFVAEAIKHGVTAQGACLATRYDRELFFDTRTSKFRLELNVRDLECRTPIGHDLRLNLDLAFEQPEGELGDAYTMFRYTHLDPTATVLSPRWRARLSLSADGVLGGGVELLGDDDEVLSTLPITKGQLAGVNLMLTVRNADGSESVFSGRVLSMFRLDESAVPIWSPNYGGIVGGESEKGHDGWWQASPSGGEPVDWGTWTGHRFDETP